MTEPKPGTATTHTVSGGLPGQPTTRHRLRRPASTALQVERHQRSRKSPHRHPACYYRCHTIHSHRQPRPLSPHVEGVVPLSTYPTRSEASRGSVAWLLDPRARRSGASFSGSCIAAGALTLPPMAGHNTTHGHIGT
ncbi:hypothetical protein PMIN01_13330 [Paraphaeosphaeria minitans]|uniref:Uncharacterized protein n=1 Tax=Paraphaeosphaeria minitans TaxID=565426 RepID=A0A9P6G466_9PLEO|nr:hypothetical protein PMIN01_13330 [Paraphaeosphaeria minitans]